MQKAAVEPRKQTEIHVSQVERPRSFSGRNVRRGGYTQNALSGNEKFLTKNTINFCL